MVDGRTIDRLREDLNSVTAELKILTREVAELKEKTKFLEGVDALTYGKLIQLLAQSDQPNSAKS